MTDERVERLRELADWCEKAKGLDRELDVAIESALGTFSDFTANEAEVLAVDLCRKYSSSIDAAMTLVPDKYADDFLIDAHGAWLGPNYMYFSEGEADFQGWGSTPALALCAAALRARAALETIGKERG